MEYRYDVRQFSWNKRNKEFYCEAYNLECIMPDGNIHPEAFPNQKQQFFIDNSKTGGFRRFRYIGDNKIEVDGFEYTQWIFESEDGIKCIIGID